MNSQSTLDKRNADFWSELCGSAFARELGITDASPESLARFDKAYFDIYPYLTSYLNFRRGKRLLEIGLGYGTVGEYLARQGTDYFGLDIASTPVEMMRTRLRALDVKDAENRVQVGSALDIPHPDSSFEGIVSIGCLHHTGDLPQAVREVKRVLQPGGRALVMLYNKWSYRRVVGLPMELLKQRKFQLTERSELARGLYDTNAAGNVAPATDFVSVKKVKELFNGFADIRIERRNFDTITFSALGHSLLTINRERTLGNIARLAGLDLYICATK